MLKETELDELKKLMPPRYVSQVITTYKNSFGLKISRWTVMRFFKGEAYSEKLHNAILTVASTQQLLMTKTKELIND